MLIGFIHFNNCYYNHTWPNIPGELVSGVRSMSMFRCGLWRRHVEEATATSGQACSVFHSTRYSQLKSNSNWGSSLWKKKEKTFGTCTVHIQFLYIIYVLFTLCSHVENHLFNINFQNDKFKSINFIASWSSRNWNCATSINSVKLKYQL